MDGHHETGTRTRQLAVPELLDALGWRRVTGKLQIATEHDLYGLFLDRGKLLAATSSHRSLRLGHVLLQRGAVLPVFLHDVLRGGRSLAPGQAIGGLLLREGAVSREDLAASVEEQAIEIVSRILSLDEASFVIVADEPLPDGMEIVALDTGHVLEEAAARQARRLSSRAMQRLLPRPDVPLTLTIQLALVSPELTDPELLVALQVDRGHRTLNQLTATLPLDALTLKRSVISLLERGYLIASYTKPHR